MVRVFQRIEFLEIGGDEDTRPSCWCVDAFGVHASGATLFECIESLRVRLLETVTEDTHAPER